MKTIILIALPSEAPNLQHMMNVFYTGVGKVNAALTAARIIERYQPTRIINIGTAGGITAGHGLHECTRFVQRDISCQPLGCADGQTPFEDDIILTTGANGLTCSTGDDFVMNSELTIPADLVDMEAYSIAKVCKIYCFDFTEYKYISDNGNHNDWTKNHNKGIDLFLQKIKEDLKVS